MAARPSTEAAANAARSGASSDHGSEGLFWVRPADESAVCWDSRSEFWDSSGTAFARQAKHARERPTENCSNIEGVQSRGVAQPGSAPALGAGGRWFESSRPDHFTQESS